MSNEINYPSAKEVQDADHQQIAQWFLNLPAFTDQCEEHIWVLISQRYYFEE